MDPCVVAVIGRSEVRQDFRLKCGDVWIRFGADAGRCSCLKRISCIFGSRN